MKLFKSSGPHAKYLQVGTIAFVLIGLLWLGPKMIRIKEANTIEAPLPAVAPIVAPPAALPTGRMDVTMPAAGIGLPGNVQDTIGTLRLSNVYRANARVGISPHRQRILA